MRDKMERFVLLPFSVGCVSESSIAVALQQPRRSSSKPSPPKNTSPTRNREDDEESLSSSTHDESMKNSFRFLAIPKPDISNGFNRLFKGFKTISQLFVYKDEMEEMEKEMEIGFPTDVKHVTHIGLDGSSSTTNNNNNPIKGWENLISPQLLTTTLPSVSLDQFELAMAAQAQAQAQPLPLVNT
ncbi:hypothetical protein Dsin_001363 [Dipteronia sinensis]|uniref:CRIB domain-containing protein n=1 Tax=Dipteronia sinensis TaxID=43782 RepID=A0AAE0B503_9ROSI|nr:hypothetical protein Dsin_001363 [Dipteronia sinensis]